MKKMGEMSTQAYNSPAHQVLYQEKGDVFGDDAVLWNLWGTIPFGLPLLLDSSLSLAFSCSSFGGISGMVERSNLL